MTIALKAMTGEPVTKGFFPFCISKLARYHEVGLYGKTLCDAPSHCNHLECELIDQSDILLSWDFAYAKYTRVKSAIYWQ